MIKTKEFQTLEESILLLQQKSKSAPLTFAESINILSGRGKSLILILLSLPFCQPIQIPGLSTPFGLVIAFIGLRLAFGKRVWLPKKWLSKTIAVDRLEKITNRALAIIRKIKHWVHPRFPWVCHSSFMEIMNGFMIFVLGILLALPLPIPLSNLTAAWSIFLIALGMLEDDGIFVLVGYLFSVFTIAFLVIMILVTPSIIHAISQ